MSTRSRVNGGEVPAFLDDAERELAKNGKAATADLIRRQATLLNQIAYAGRPWYTWVMQQDIAHNKENAFRQAYAPMNLGATVEGGLLLWIHRPFDPDTPHASEAGQGIQISINGNDYLTRTNYDLVLETSYPEDALEVDFHSSFGYLDGVVEATISSMTEQGPDMRAGAVWQDGMNQVDPELDGVAGTSDLHQKGDIVAVRSTGNDSIGQMLFVYRNAIQHLRVQFGWSAFDPGGTNRYVAFTTDKQNYRYIFDQAYGAGGTTITATTPAITLPLRYAGVGTRKVVRVYVFVYAAMSGATNTGAIGIANKDPDGSMDVPTAVTNPITISGTAFAWYPTLASFDPETSPYFEAYAGDASPFDRVALCARSSGAVDSVRIAAFTFVVMHSTAS